MAAPITSLGYMCKSLVVSFEFKVLVFRFSIQLFSYSKFCVQYYYLSSYHFFILTTTVNISSALMISMLPFIRLARISMFLSPWPE
jgi:hypothetical protein